MPKSKFKGRPKRLPMNHSFLTGMEGIVHPSARGTSWDCVPYDQHKVDEVNHNKTAVSDLQRTPWYFGVRGEDKEGVVERENSAMFKSHADFRLYTWLVPEKKPLTLENSQSLTLSEALQNKNALEKLLLKANEHEKRLQKNGIDYEKPAAIDQLEKYLKASEVSEESKEDEMSVREEVEKIVNWIEEGRKKLPQTELGERDREERTLDLSDAESKALFAFSVSVGDGVVIQAGAVRGVGEACFGEGWLLQTYGYTRDKEKVKDPGFYDEGYRLRRLPDGRISMSSYLQIGKFKEHDSSDADALVSVESEQIFEQKMDSNNQPIFTMRPSNQTIELDENLYEEILKKAIARLESIQKNNEVFRPSDFFALIPFLDNETYENAEQKKLRDQFYLAMSKQPDFVFDFAKKWISKYYVENSELGAEICNQLDHHKASIIPENEKPRIIQDNLNAPREYVGYLYDHTCANGFMQKMNDELRTMGNEKYDSVLSNIRHDKAGWGEKHTAVLSGVQETVNQRVKKRLFEIEEKGEVFRPADIMKILPYLQDLEIRKSFCKAMIKQPQFVFDYVCEMLKSQDFRISEMSAIITEMGTSQRLVGTPREKDKLSLMKSPTTVGGFNDYFDNPVSAKPFREALREEVKNKNGYSNALLSIDKERGGKLSHMNRNILWAFIRLDEITQKKALLTPADLDKIIPCLQKDEELQKLFCKVMQRQPSFVMEYVNKLILNTYNQNTAQQEFMVYMGQQLYSLKRENDQPSIINSSTPISHYLGYATDISSEKGFKEALGQEMKKVNQNTYDSVLAEIKKTPRTENLVAGLTPPPRSRVQGLTNMLKRGSLTGTGSTISASASENTKESPKGSVTASSHVKDATEPDLSSENAKKSSRGGMSITKR